LNKLLTTTYNTGDISGNYPCNEANIHKLGWIDWYSKCGKDRYDSAKSMLAELSSRASQSTSDSAKADQFAKKLGIIQFWQNIIAGLTADSFIRQTEVKCGVLFNRNQQITLKLLIADRTSVFDGQIPQPQTKEALL